MSETEKSEIENKLQDFVTEAMKKKYAPLWSKLVTLLYRAGLAFVIYIGSQHAEGAKESIDKVGVKVSDVQSRVTSLEGQVVNRDHQVAEVTTKLDDLKTAAEIKNSDFLELRAEFKANKVSAEQWNSYHREIDKQFNDVNRRVDKLEAIGESNSESLKRLETHLGTLNIRKKNGESE